MCIMQNALGVSPAKNKKYSWALNTQNALSVQGCALLMSYTTILTAKNLHVLLIS